MTQPTNHEGIRAKFRLPNVPSDGEYEGQLTTFAGERWRSFDINGARIIVRESDLTEVPPPPPLEPPIGAYRVGGVLCMRVSSEPEKCWVYQTTDEMFAEKTFEDICSDHGSDIVRLVPAPEPVELPWSRKYVDGKRFLVTKSSASNRAVYVQGWGHLTIDESRQMAYAALAAADAAEREVTDV